MADPLSQPLILNITTHLCLHCGHQWDHSVPHIAAFNGSYIGSAMLRPQDLSLCHPIAAIPTAKVSTPYCHRCILTFPNIAHSWADLALSRQQTPRAVAGHYAGKSLDDLLK